MRWLRQEMRAAEGIGLRVLEGLVSPGLRRRRRSGGRLGVIPIVVLAGAIGGSCAYDAGERPELVVATAWGGAGAEVLSQELIRITRDLGPVAVDLRFFSPTGLSDHLLRRQTPRTADRVDLAIVPNDWLGQLAERAITIDLPTPRAAHLRARLLRQALLAVSARDGVLAYPLSAEVLAFVYDPERFPSRPATMDDVLAAPLPEGVLPFAISVLSIHHLAPFVASYQGSLASQEGAFLFRDDVLLGVLRRLAPVWRRDHGWQVFRAEAHESLFLQLFAEGRLASFLTGPSLLPALEETGRPFSVMPIPPFDDSPHTARGLVSYQCLVVMRESRWVDLGLELGERLLDAGANERLNRGTRRLPVLTEAYRSEAAMASGGTIGFWRALEEGQSFPTAADWTEGFHAVADRLQRFRRINRAPAPQDLPALLGGGER